MANAKPCTDLVYTNINIVFASSKDETAKNISTRVTNTALCGGGIKSAVSSLCGVDGEG